MARFSTSLLLQLCSTVTLLSLMLWHSVKCNNLSYNISLPAFLSRPVRSSSEAPSFGTRSTSPAAASITRPTQLMLGRNGRIPVIGGNWKSNGTVDSTQKLVELLNKDIPDTPSMQVIVAPPSIHLGYVRDNLKHKMKVAAQNVGVHRGYGAFTGEMSGGMLKDFGIDWCVTGHSERREGFGMQGECSELVARKTKAAIQEGLNVIACIGEKLAERESGRTMDVLNEQLSALKKELNERDWQDVVLAYEPVWAIGTGKTATPQMAQLTHKDIRNWLSSNVSPRVAEQTRIIYGGSVKGSNTPDLSREEDIDGFLVGGASLNADFIKIVNAAVQQSGVVA